MKQICTPPNIVSPPSLSPGSFEQRLTARRRRRLRIQRPVGAGRFTAQPDIGRSGSDRIHAEAKVPSGVAGRWIRGRQRRRWDGGSHLFVSVSSGGPPIVSSTIALRVRPFGKVSRRSGGVTIVVTRTITTEAEKTSRPMISWASP